MAILCGIERGRVEFYPQYLNRPWLFAVKAVRKSCIKQGGNKIPRSLFYLEIDTSECMKSGTRLWSLTRT